MKETYPEPVWLGKAEYVDLDKDGKEELALIGRSCLAGTGGPDLFGVFQIGQGGQVASLPLPTDTKYFQGRDLSEGLHGKMWFEVEGQRLVTVFPVYAPDDANCCPSRGQRKFVYRLEAARLILEDVVDVPPNLGNNPDAK